MNIFNKALHRNQSQIIRKNKTGVFSFMDGKRPVVNNEKQLALSAFFSGAQMISSNIACLTPMVEQRYDNGQTFKRQGNYLQEKLEYQPSKRLTSYKYMKVMVANMITHGNAYSLIKRNGNKVDELIHYKPQDVDIFQNNKTGDIYYQFKDDKIKHPAHDVIHLYNFSLDGISGLSYIEAGFRNQLESHLSVQEFNQKYFQNNTFLGGILSVKGSLGTDESVVNEAKSEIREEWEQIYSGADNAGKIAILEGDYDYQGLDLSAKDSQLIERSEFTVAEVSRILNIPLSLLGVPGANSYNSVESDSKMYAQNAVLPIIKIIEQEYRSKLFTEAEKEDGYHIHIDHSEIEKVTLTDKGDYVASMINNGVFTINEARTFTGHSSRDGFDFSVVQKNVDILDEGGEIRQREADNG